MIKAVAFSGAEESNSTETILYIAILPECISSAMMQTLQTVLGFKDYLAILQVIQPARKSI